ncbi:helix-turn-helix transcriptional regulator [Leptothoe sp. LEGE 181152]|nr:helix-turn-helix transcriptional regulator [Leptothoe sp. LEGE 181152]
MGKAGDTLKQVLDKYNITQYRFAATMGVERTSVARWCKGKIDPTGDSIIEIVRTLKILNQDAATEFVRTYLSNELDP